MMRTPPASLLWQNNFLPINSIYSLISRARPLKFQTFSLSRDFVTLARLQQILQAPGASPFGGAPRGLARSAGKLRLGMKGAQVFYVSARVFYVS